MNSEQSEKQREYIYLNKLLRKLDVNYGRFYEICEALEIDHDSGLTEILVAIERLK